MNVILISELVNKDGSRIKGDARVDQDNNMTTSKITTDDFIQMTRQGLSKYNNFGRLYYGENDDTNDEVGLPPEDKKQKNKKKTKLKKKSKKKMKSIVEDIFTKKDFDKEFVDKKYKDLKSSGIGGLESIRDTNPILIRKVGALKDIIEKNSTSGEEKAVILNHLLTMDISDIPQEYKQELKKKLG